MIIKENNWILISYYTPNYKEIAEKYLLSSLKNFGFPHYVEEVENQGNWKKNTDFKPHFVKKCLDKFPNNLIITDADSTINSYPSLFDELNNSDYDLGVHYLDYFLHYGRPSDKRRSHLASGTIYFKNNAIIRLLVDKWIKYLFNFAWEQQALEKASKEILTLKIFQLPREYCYIVSTPRGNPTIPLENPIISHYQASRTFRRKMQ